MAFVKRLLVGRPLATTEKEHQRLPKTIALAVFSSDAISSTAYATEEILFVIAVGGSSLALGLDKLVPIAIAVAILLAIVVTSYRQTIFAYPSGGGSYVVSRENLGETPSLVAGASLLVDYILTVAVSISAGRRRHHLDPRLPGPRATTGCCSASSSSRCISVANLRGVKESGGSSPSRPTSTSSASPRWSSTACSARIVARRHPEPIVARALRGRARRR